MNPKKTLLAPELLADGAFLILSSSSLHRYIGVAQYLAKVSPILNKLETGELKFDDLLAQARFLWRELLRKPYRDIQEVELATILTIIANRTEDEVSEFLNIIGVSDQLQVSWLSALARHLYRHQANNIKVSIEAPTVKFIDMQNNLTKDLASDTQESYDKLPTRLSWPSIGSTNTELRPAA